MPFQVEGENLGTLWVISHSERQKFNGAHAGILKDLSTFGTTAYRVLSSLGYLDGGA